MSFRPFPELVDSDNSRSVEAHKAAIRSLIAGEQYQDAQEMSMELVRIGLQGLRYFQT